MQALVRETPQYREAVARGEPADEVLKILLADTPLRGRAEAGKTRVQAGFAQYGPRHRPCAGLGERRDFAADPFDHVQAARRQPGSTFKPFVYGAALRRGRCRTTTLDGLGRDSAGPATRCGAPPMAVRPATPMTTLADGLAFSKHHHRAGHAGGSGPR